MEILNRGNFENSFENHQGGRGEFFESIFEHHHTSGWEGEKKLKVFLNIVIHQGEGFWSAAKGWLVSLAKSTRHVMLDNLACALLPGFETHVTSTFLAKIWDVPPPFLATVAPSWDRLSSRDNRVFIYTYF